MGVITGAKGLKGEIRVKSFTALESTLFDYGPLTDENSQKQFTGQITGQSSGQLLVKFDGIENRAEADAIKGQRLYVNRNSLPETERDEYYYSDLIGLNVESRTGEYIGIVRWIFEVGAGASLEVETETETIMVPFTKANVPLIDIENSRVILDPVEGIFDKPLSRNDKISMKKD